MILASIFLAALILIGLSARALDESPSPRESLALDVLLFAACLFGIVAARRRADDDDSE